MKIQINNDFQLALSVLANGTAEPLTYATDIEVAVQNLDAPRVRCTLAPVVVNGNVVTVAVDSTVLNTTGRYLAAITYVINGARRYAENGDAFTLVRSAAEADIEGESAAADLHVKFEASGKDGLSAYELAKQAGYAGTFEEWLAAGENANNAALLAKEGAALAATATKVATDAAQKAVEATSVANTAANRANAAADGVTGEITRIDAAAVGSLQVDADADKVAVKGTSLSGEEVATVDIPVATTERAGVMSAEDKKEQVKKTPLVNGDIIVGQAREIYSRTGKTDSATFLERTTAGGTSVSDGVASVKQIGGNIVKNLVDGTFGDGWDKFSTIAIANGVAKITTTSPYTGVSYAVQLVTGHKYYAKVDACGNNTFYASFTKSKPYYISQQWACVSFLHTSVNDDIALRIMATSAEAQGFFKKPLVIDLTEHFGEGKEPTKEECDRMFGAMGALPQGLTIAQPTGLKSTGYNQWNPANIIKDKTIANNAITDLAGGNIAVVECLPCAVGAGENNGYVIGYGAGDSWSDDGIEVYLSPLNPMEIEGELYMSKLEKDATYGTYVPQIKGYLLVVTPTTDKLCAHLHWSGDRVKTDYEDYVESNVALPTISDMSEWGLAGISASSTMVQDSIDLDKMVYTKRIGRVDLGSLVWSVYDIDYNSFVCRDLVASIGANILCEKYLTSTKANLTEQENMTIRVASSGAIFIKDSAYTNINSLKNALQGVILYYELAEPEEYPIVTKTAPNYIGSDYGVEEFTGSKIPLAANILFYMRSLVGETRNFLDQLYTNTQKSDAKEVANYITNGIEDNKQLATNAPNLALRALYIAAGALYNDTGADIIRTAPWGESVTHKDGYYYLNGLGDITEGQMINIYNVPHNCLYEQAYIGTHSQTVFFYGSSPTAGLTHSPNGLFMGCTELKVIAGSGVLYFAPSCEIVKNVFRGCTNLEHIVLAGFYGRYVKFEDSVFKGCKSLVNIKITQLEQGLSFADSPQINKESILFIINNAIPKSVITITLHADAYARLAEDAEIVDALDAQPLVSLVSA